MTDWEHWQQAVEISSKFGNHYSASRQEQYCLYRHALTLGVGDNIVELGVCNGQTAAVLSHSTNFTEADYTGIDNWLLESSRETVQDLFNQFDLSGDLVRSDTHTSPWLYGPISLLFVDAGHDEANVKPDCEIWVPRVCPGGIAAFHDYEEPYDPDSCHWAVRYYADKATKGWERLDWVGGLMVFRRPM